MLDTRGILHHSFVIKKAYDSLWDGICAKFALTRAEIDVIAFLAHNPDFDTASDIVDYRMIAKSHVSKAVDSLMERRFVTRTQDEHDRRCIHLALTEAAREAVSAILTRQEEFTRALEEGFTQEELDRFGSMAERIAENAEKTLE